MPDHVRDCLLDDAEGGEVDLGGERAARPAPLHVDPDAGVHRDGGKPAQIGQARCGIIHRLAWLIAWLGPAQRAQHPPQPGQRLPAGGLDGAQRVPCRGGLGVDDPAAGASLDRDDADVVRHHVVQFAGDPQPLGGYHLHLGLGPQRLAIAADTPLSVLKAAITAAAKWLRRQATRPSPG